VQGLLGSDHHSASGGASAASIGEEVEEHAGVRLERKRAGAEVQKEIGMTAGFHQIRWI
jgi:hypothetical protein